MYYLTDYFMNVAGALIYFLGEGEGEGEGEGKEKGKGKGEGEGEAYGK